MADVSVNPESTNPSELLGQGIKAFILQDFEASVAALSRASELLVKEHEGNDLHDSLGEVYLYYGKALLGLSREQNEALGDAVPKDNEESEDDDEGIETEETENNENEENEQNAKNEDKSEEKSKEDQKTSEQKTEDKNGVAQSSEANGESKANGEAEAANGESAATNGEAGPSSSKAVEEPDSTEDASQDDEPTDLQVAWEVLELAKKIYQRGGEESRKKLADTLIVLGEVSLESENFEAAVNDIKEGLEIQKALFGGDSRMVAETYYKLGVAYSTDSQMTEAIASFEKSLEYLRNRIGALEKLDQQTDESKEEIEDIKSLIPDIEEKIADMKSSKEEAIKKITEAIREPGRSGDGAGPSSASSSKPATNISHLVKRKRKPDEADGKEEELPAKKPATEGNQ